MVAHRALMAAIVAAPDDDAPRLVLADWLEQQGETAAAEFLRIGCALAQVPQDGPRWFALKSRQLNLLAHHPELRTAGIEPRRGITWHPPTRGLVEGLTAQSLSALERMAEDLFARMPIRHIELPKLSRQGMVRLLRHAWLARLSGLDLGGSRLGDDAMVPLWSSREDFAPKVLGLDRNELTRVSIERLAAWPGLGGLRFLALGHNRVTSEDLALLVESPHFHPGLVIELRRGDFSVAAAQWLRTLFAGRVRFLDPMKSGPGRSSRARRK